ncbi:murein hydrolase activator EnvC precursor [mine drainage metagenome]|uniref:Murein hydrolase activator EnvC n=1 Tax=mine drainage metagenome TaxID=410659 RepID=A0A1J5SXB0_9ZZZZ
MPRPDPSRTATKRKGRARALRLALLLSLACTAAAAQTPPPPKAPAPGQRLKELEQALKKGQVEQAAIRRAAAEQAKELAGLKGDMINAARAVQEHEDSLSDLEQKMADLDRRERRESAALELKRQQLNGVLTALMRLAFHPTEALIAQPTSPADTVRSAILLRDVTPRIQQATKDLRADLDALTALRSDVSRQRRRIKAATQELDVQHRTLAALYQRKALLQEQTESRQRESESRLQTLAGEAQDLRDLMARLEQERIRREQEEAARIAAEKARREAERAAAAAAAEAARKAEIAARTAAREAAAAARKAAREKHAAERAAAERAHAAELRAQHDAAAAEARAAKARRTEVAAEAAGEPRSRGDGRPFAQAEGRMPFPARGAIVRHFGQRDASGAPSRGITIATRPDAQVVAPYDGQIVFAGPFRDYGLLLIIEHTEGYHTLLAGLARIDGRVGQHLLAGEPVGVMGRSGGKPLLYVELRHDGQPVNPLPWLTARKTKVSG